MEQDPEEQAIVKWLKMVDKPLKTKEGDRKQGRVKNETEQKKISK